ncbi:pyruvate carboxylase [Saccharopolyspora erythraea NRRL 2338]|uniref:acetyl-CoA carboxylase n=2 Tax=Saccharopolyspora erythraea TaxID=1836 RepID=A4FEF6_SACEN|nr:carboxyl transferase domain-containing protein [Saccharopolyspora erythraea]PFG96156.1 pyruvate carboxylase [Saccharopolyspora erythraea NRRL 2338]QRK93586.1 carbamoyl-phosphate synthase large subunit [Saccharopolyspora erythraea]CAM02431.1 biotin carboxylase [Saccharopolyspora erythraea NRRL 2338]
MQIAGLLVANRAEVAVRVIRAAGELGVETVAVHAADDADALHVRMADRAVPLPGTGPAGYLDGAALVDAARSTGCDAVHPGYGFLAENAGFARACVEAGLTWVGPEPETLDVLGDKTRARELAARCGVPVLAGTSAISGPDEAEEFRAGLPGGSAVVVKAVAGGGGRGMRVVAPHEDLAEAVARCRSEARAAFGDDGVFVEQLLRRARHIEVQVLADAGGAVAVLGDRDCSLQRRRQKLVEIAPAPDLPDEVRKALAEAASTLAGQCGYRGLGTFEFLVEAGDVGEPRWYFMEANPRLQVEHTVTEEVTGIDLVRAQIRVAAGASLADLGLAPGELPAARGFAVQARLNTERLTVGGQAVPATGTITAYEPPGGPGLRVDGCGYPGYRVSPRYDSTLAKLVARDSAPVLADAVGRAHRALGEFRVEGVATNRELLRSLLARPEVRAGAVHTTFVDDVLSELDGVGVESVALPGRDDVVEVTAPMAATVVEVCRAPGEPVRGGEVIAVLEAMKMQHPVSAATPGVVAEVLVKVDDVVTAGQPVALVSPGEEEDGGESGTAAVDLDAPRPDLAALRERRAVLADEARPDAVARWHDRGRRTARENIADLCDEGTFVEYGGLAIAAQRRRRSLRDLVERTPADGLVAGVGAVNGADFEHARVVAMSYDYLVLAGTQGQRGHAKKDRMFELAESARLPVVLFAEGGGGRPGDTDGSGVTGLDCRAFALYARLSGVVPLVGIASGRCFAGNAALLGCSDVVIATPDASIGMGGPAMIEGGGLGVFAPDEVGPTEVQRANGVIDLVARDDADAVALARKYLSYFQGAASRWEAPDARRLRHAVPENRLRVYDVRALIEDLADVDSVLELRRDFGHGAVTALVRVEGRPLGLIANNPAHLGGAIDSPAADKIARFLQLCDAFGLPVLSLCDTPGFMVGPDAERTATVRHVSRMFVNAAAMSVPFGVIVLRKGYGLGAQAMAAGGFREPRFTIAWPTGEFGPMGLEGAVRLGYRKELEAIADPAQRQRRFEEMVAAEYERGQATNVASAFEIDDVIDPAESRRWIAALLTPEGPSAPAGGRRPCVDTW